MKKENYLEGLPEEMKERLKPFSTFTLEYGVFTAFELLAAIDYLESDFGDLFWLVNNLKGEELKRHLRLSQLEYDHRFYLKYCKGENEMMCTHIHKKLTIFIEDCMKHPPKKIAERKMDLSDILKLPEEKNYLIKELIKNDFILESDNTWKFQRRNQKTILVNLFNILREKGYLKKEMDREKVLSNICENFFHYPISNKTFQENIGSKKFYHFFNFIEKSKAL